MRQMRRIKQIVGIERTDQEKELGKDKETSR